MPDARVFCRLLAPGAFLGQRRLDLPEGRVLGGDDVEDDRVPGVTHTIELAHEILETLHADADTAHGLGDPRVVLASQLVSDEAIAAAALAVLHPAEHAVVEDHGDDRDL